MLIFLGLWSMDRPKKWALKFKMPHLASAPFFFRWYHSTNKRLNFYLTQNFLSVKNQNVCKLWNHMHTSFKSFHGQKKLYSLKNNTKNNKKYLLLQTVGFDTPAQLNKGTSTDESDGEDHFYYLTSSVPRGFEDSSNCHLCHHNQALSPFTQLGSGNVDIAKP